MQSTDAKIVGGFFLVTSVFTLEKFETIPFSGIRLEPTRLEFFFHVEAVIDCFSLPVNNFAYLTLRNFNTTHFTTFLNHEVRIFLFGKGKKYPSIHSLYACDILKKRINLKVADDISQFE